MTRSVERETPVMALDTVSHLTHKGVRLARITIVNFYGNIVLDTVVKPFARLDPHQSFNTGIMPADFELAPSYSKIALLVSSFSCNSFRCAGS